MIKPEDFNKNFIPPSIILLCTGLPGTSVVSPLLTNKDLFLKRHVLTSLKSFTIRRKYSLRSQDVTKTSL